MAIMERSCKLFYTPLSSQESQYDTADDSGVFSDDTGICSLSEEYSEPPREDSPPLLCRTLQTSPNNYDTLLKKYMDMIPKFHSADLDPFIDVDFEELIELLILSVDISGLNVAATLLDFTLAVWNKQVLNCQRCVKSLAGDCVRQKKLTAVLSDRMDQCRTGTTKIIANDLPHSSTSQVLSKEVSKPATSMIRKSFVVDDNQIYISLTDAVPDVVQRRKIIAAKIGGLAYDTLLDSEFDIHNFHESESLDKHPLKGMIQLPGLTFPKLQDMFIPAYKPLSSDEESIGSDTETETNSDENVMRSEESDLEPQIELENFMPSLIDQSVFDESLLSSASAVIPPELSQENAIDDKTASKGLKKRAPKRQPLEPLNSDDSQSGAKEDDITPPIEIKRSRLDDEAAVINDSIASFDNHGEDILSEEELSLPPLPDQNFMNQDPDTSPNESTEARGYKLPSPLCVEEEDNLFKKLVFPRKVDMMALIGAFEKVVVDEIRTKQRNEIPFEEIAKKSKVVITASSFENETSRRKRLQVSVATAFFACLHLAHMNQLFLTTTEDNLFKITTIKPEDPSTSS